MRWPGRDAGTGGGIGDSDYGDLGAVDGKFGLAGWGVPRWSLRGMWVVPPGVAVHFEIGGGMMGFWIGISHGFALGVSVIP